MKVRYLLPLTALPALALLLTVRAAVGYVHTQNEAQACRDLDDAAHIAAMNGDTDKVAELEQRQIAAGCAATLAAANAQAGTVVDMVMKPEK